MRKRTFSMGYSTATVLQEPLQQQGTCISVAHSTAAVLWQYETCTPAALYSYLNRKRPIRSSFYGCTSGITVKKACQEIILQLFYTWYLPGKIQYHNRRNTNFSVWAFLQVRYDQYYCCLLYTSPSPRDRQKSRMPSSA